MKLLIVDDDLTTCTMLDAVTQEWGFKPIIADNGEAAWQILQEEDSPNLLLLDWIMPQLTGPNLCRRIRQQENDNPPYIILLTVRNTTTDIVKGLEAGANDYIAKPFETPELKARLQVGRRMLDLQAQLNSATKALIYQASHDEVTGLKNRWALMYALEEEITRAQRQSQCLCIVLCDIDHFKQVNDTHGHLTGDAVLREVAARMTTTIRPYDHIGRYGGEEFLILLNAAEDQVANACERIRHAIADTPIITKENELKVTISCGATLFMPPDDNRGKNTLLAAADSALYKAKSSGRNCTVISSP